MSLSLGLGLALTRNKGVGGNAWRFASGKPVRRAQGGFWKRS